jgi:hypothetical protein
MKKIITILTLLTAQSAFAVEGYKDIYLDREKTINIHKIYCAKVLNKIRDLKPSYVYTNTANIEVGTYHMSSAYGSFSYTFTAIPNKDSKKLLARGKLSGGKTQKSDMVKEACIVGKIEGLPAKLNDSITVTSIIASDPQWNQSMKKYTMFGKPAFADGVYADPKTLAQYDAHNQKVFDANQRYIEEAKKIFREKYKRMVAKLPEQLSQAIAYAHQYNGFAKDKVYPTTKEPLVWTPTAKERYNDLSRRRGQKIDWDHVTQDNFDWFFKLTGQSNSLESTATVSTADVVLNGNRLEQIATVSALFANGKTLELDFLITTKKLPNDVFHSLDEIKKQAIGMRANLIGGAKKVRQPITSPKQEYFDVYNPVKKVDLFFSLFRLKKLGDTYRYL